MRKVGILIGALAVLALWGVAFADVPEPPAAEAPAPAAAAPAEAPPPAAAPDAELKAALEKTQAALGTALRRIDELEAKVGTLGGQVGSASKDVSSISTQMRQLEEKAKQPAPAAPVVFKPYGYIKVDMVYDSTRTAGTDCTAFVLPEKPGFANDQHFSITVRQTRLGVNIAGPDLDSGKTMGKVEIDFYAPASIENKPELMLRQAFWQATFDDWNVLVGQTWEVVSPLFPNTLNYSYLALSGNPGYRKPMVRYERTDKVLGDKTLQTDVALVRGIGASVRSASSLDDQSSDAAWPNFQARLGMTFPTAGGAPVVVGLSGHVGQDEYDPAAGTARGNQYATYMGNVDFKFPVVKKVDVVGEVWRGRNLNGYMGGIGQGVNDPTTQSAATIGSALNKGIDAWGGWTQVCYKPTDKWFMSVGLAIDDPENGDLSGSINRARNATYFTNALYNLNKQATVGVEVSYQQTNYIGTADGENLRVQGALQFNF